jgi:hypothetical protein
MTEFVGAGANTTSDTEREKERGKERGSHRETVRVDMMNESLGDKRHILFPACIRASAAPA